MTSPSAMRSLCVLMVGWLIMGSSPEPTSSQEIPQAKNAIKPVAPLIPPPIITQLQEGKYGPADAELSRWADDPKRSADERTYAALIRGIAARLGNRPEDASKLLRAALERDPKGVWAAKLRFELAGVELAAGRPDAAEALLRAETESLLAVTRKDGLARIYFVFADRLVNPGDPVVKPDLAGALALLAKAQTLAKGESLRAEIMALTGRVQVKANQHAEAIATFTTYVSEFKQGAERFAVRYALGEEQLIMKNLLVARLTWTDLARDLEQPAGKDAKLADLRALSLFGVSKTHGSPNPANDTAANLAIAALKRYLTAYPAHRLAVRAAYDIALCSQSRGRSEDALASYRTFLSKEGFQASDDESKRDLAQLSMNATFQVGSILFGQRRFNEAIEGWKSYLAQFPNGPQSAQAQASILSVELAIADDLNTRKEYVPARAAWTAFAARNPLDNRIPQVLLNIGESFRLEKKFDEAIAAWENLAGKFPNNERAAFAQFQVASTFETEKGDPAGAIERFKKIVLEPWRSQAAQRIAVMEAKALTVATPRVFRSGETGQLKIFSRNIEKLTFTAYKLNAETYFRKKHLLSEVESLDISLVQPDAEWTTNVPGYSKYKPVQTNYDLAKIELPGVFVVKVTDEKKLQATTLVVGSDIDAVVKTSSNQVLAFAQDMKTGKGRAGARVLLSDGKEILLEGKTGADGVLLTDWPKARDPNSAVRFLVLDGAHVAASGLGLPAHVSQGLVARAYLYTDRPAYRPGQSVSIRGVIREVKAGQYSFDTGATYRMEVTDSRGRTVLNQPVTLSEFGTIQSALALDEAAPLGTYRINVFQPGRSTFGGSFEVQTYRLAKIDLSMDFPKTVYFRGEKISGSVIAKYQYGTPVSERVVRLQLPDGTIKEGKTDAAGKYPIEFDTFGYAEEQALRLVALLPEESVATAATLNLAIRAFRVGLKTSRTVYLDGESFLLDVNTEDAQGKPTGENLGVSVLKIVNEAGRTTQRETFKTAAKTDPKTGQVRVSLKVDDVDGGDFLLRVTGTDRFGNPVFADRVITISGAKDANKLRILAERQTFKVGETAEVSVQNRTQAGTALLTWEADRILKYQLAQLKEGSNSLSWKVEGAQFPNFTLTAARMAGETFQEARLDVRVERELTVVIQPTKPRVGPGEEVAVDVQTTDQLGNPVAAELSIALIDKSLLKLYGDPLPPIGRFFYDQSRQGAFSTSSTNTFKYEPPTTEVATAVVEEQEAKSLRDLDEKQQAQVYQKLQTMAGIAPAPAPMPASAPMPGMMGAMPGQGAGMGQVFARSDEVKDRASMGALSVAPGSQGGVGGTMGGGGFAGRPNGELAEVARDAERSEVEFMGKEVAAKGAARRKTGGDANFAYDKAGVPSSRQQFVETAYWNPAVATDKSGKARVTFRAPSALSEYQFTMRGTTGLDTLVGQSQSELAVRQNFFVELRTPDGLTEGDKPRLMAELHHEGVRGDVTVKLTAYAAGRQSVFPKTIKVEADGVTELVFDPYEVPRDDTLRLTVNAAVRDVSDEIVVEVPIRPWGVQAIASAAGSSSNDVVEFVGLPAARNYEAPEMVILLSPTIRRMIIELALQENFLFKEIPARCIFPPPSNTVADRASDLIAVGSAFEYLRAIQGAAAPEAARLSGRIQGLASELVSLQNEDGGWPWIPVGDGKTSPSDVATSSRAIWALNYAESQGLLSDRNVMEKGVNYLSNVFSKNPIPNDPETRAMVVHALSVRKRASFEAANSLNRLRQNLPSAALAYLAMTFANLDREGLAREVLDLLARRARTETVSPGRRPLIYWTSEGSNSWHSSAIEVTALCALALGRSNPGDERLAGAIEWLLSKRSGAGWSPSKARGPVLAALSGYQARAGASEDRYRLIISVNGQTVLTRDVQGALASQGVRVPQAILKPGAPNQVKFDIEGRGSFGYAVTLSGFTRDFAPDQETRDRKFVIERRVYGPVAPELFGKVLPTGFSSVVNAQEFENKVTQVEQGGRAVVKLDAYRASNQAEAIWDRGFLVLEDTLPAGTTLIEDSVESEASYHTLENGVLTFYFAPDQSPGSISYEVLGSIPGQYRALPTRIRNAYDPGQYHLGPVGDLRVRRADEPSTDPYQATPDELLARGKALFDTGKMAEAALPLEELFGKYTLQDPKDVTRMLLYANIQEYQPRKIVQYFEILKEKSPEFEIPFEKILVVGRAYRDIQEYERAALVWRAIAEASYLEDVQLGEMLRQRGKSLEGIAMLVDLWRVHPNTAAIESDFFGLSQLVASLPTQAESDPALRRQLLDAGVSGPELRAQSVQLIQVLLALSPNIPLADEACLAQLNTTLEMEQFETVVTLARRFTGLYPKSRFLDSFQYSEVLGLFNLAQYDRAVEIAEKITKSVYKDANGVDQPSPNRLQALYILGQIFDARRDPGKAISFYEQVKEQFTDAAVAVTSYTRKSLHVDEVTVSRPAVVGVLAGDVGAAAKAKAQAKAKAADPKPSPVSIKLSYRNLESVDVKVYPVDLMRLYLTRRNLDTIAGIDLAGITPLHEATVALGDGKDYENKIKEIDLPLKSEGAYLVMIRGENLYTSGVILVSPMEMSVVEESDSGRVRVTLRDARTKAFMPKVQVKVIGTNNPTFFSGETDLRGVFLVEGVRGQVTAVARQELTKYAFHRGTIFLGPPPTPAQTAAPAEGMPNSPANQTLDQNLKSLNQDNRARQLERMQERFQNNRRGVISGDAF